METALFPSLFSIIILFLLVVIAVLLFLALAYRRLAENFETLQRLTTQNQSGELQPGLTALDSARKEAQKILERAQLKSAEMMITSEFFTASSQKEFAKQLQEATQGNLREYTQLLAELRQDLEKTFTSMSQEIESGAQKELENFRQQTQTQSQQVQAKLEERMNQSTALAEAEITAYKESRIKKIDKETEAIVIDVVKEIAPQMIPAKNHQELVIQALTEAKQRHAI